MAQVMIIMRSKSNYKRLDVKIKELSYINEMSMTLGLFILSIGTFLGGVWANESWGRYWAWDPKETWALISWQILPIRWNALVEKTTARPVRFSLIA